MDGVFAVMPREEPLREVEEHCSQLPGAVEGRQGLGKAVPEELHPLPGQVRAESFSLTTRGVVNIRRPRKQLYPDAFTSSTRDCVAGARQATTICL